KWMAHGSSMILVQPQSVSAVTRLGNRHAMEQQSLLRSKISMLRSTNLKAAVSASISKRLKRLCAGWRNFAIQTETSWSFTNERNDEARMTNVEGNPNARMSCSGRRVACGIYTMQPTRLPPQIRNFVIGTLLVIRHSSFVIGHSDHVYSR